MENPSIIADKYQEAVNLFNRGNLTEAENILLYLAEENKQDFDVLNFLGIIKLNEKKYEEAAGYFLNVISLCGSHIHEQIEDSIKENNYPVINSSVEIIHLGYNVGEDELHLKAERNLQILLDEYKQTGTSYYAFQLGQTLGILNRKQEAEHYFSEALKDNSLSGEYRGIAFRYLAINNAERKNFNTALQYIEQSIKEDDKQPLNLMAAAKLYLHFKMNDKAADCAMKSYNANKTFFDKGMNSAQNIMLDEKELCLHGLEVAVKGLNKNLFSFFFQKIKNDSGKEWEVFNSIYCNDKISESGIAAFTQSLEILSLQ